MAPPCLACTTIALLLNIALAFFVISGSAFGTVWSPDVFKQRAEHERLTRAALGCYGQSPIRDCFERRSLDQLAGYDGSMGAVGAPDINEALSPQAHCDNADFFDSEDYPQSRG